MKQEGSYYKALWAKPSIMYNGTCLFKDGTVVQ